MRSRATIISTSDVDRIGLRCHGRQMKHATVVPVIRSKYEALAPLFNEHQSRRLWAASESRRSRLWWDKLPARATGLDRDTIASGLRELDHPSAAASHRPCPPARCGTQIVCGNRPAVAGCSAYLGIWIDPFTPRGPAARPCVWNLQEHPQPGQRTDPPGTHPISPRTVAALLYEAGYSLQANRKTHEGAADHPGSRRPVPPHQRSGHSLATTTAASDLRGLQKEGESGRFQERRR